MCYCRHIFATQRTSTTADPEDPASELEFGEGTHEPAFHDLRADMHRRRPDQALAPDDLACVCETITAVMLVLDYGTFMIRMKSSSG